MFAIARRAACLAAALPLVTLAACGGSDAGTLDKSAIAAKADAICTSANAKANKLTTPKSAADAAGIASYYGSLAALATAQHRQLDDLSPADDVQADWKAYMTLDDQITTTVEQLAAAAKAKDGTKMQQLVAKVGTLSTTLNAAADKVGAKTCGSQSGKR